MQLSFRTRTILLFSIITTALVIVMSRVSYYTVKEIYLNQLTDQVLLTTRVVMTRFNTQHVRYLNAKDERTMAGAYYTAYLAEQKRTLKLEDLSIFNEDLQTLASTDSGNAVGFVEPALLFSRTEIQSLGNGESVTSLPFKGEDGRWYLWGFCRIDDGHWLSIRENADRLARVEQLSLVFWGIGLAGILVTLGGGILLVRTLARPIDRLTRFSRELGKGNWEAPVPQDVKGELASLAQAMHLMREDLLARQKEKETILAHIAHEIRNPLGGIELLTGLIKEDLEKEHKNSEYAQKILNEIGGMKSLVNNYLNFGRASVAHPEDIEVSEIAAEVTNLLQTRLKEKNIEVTVAESGSVRFDRNHLRHILINLMTNAIEAVPEKGQIVIRTKVDGESNLLEISDNGPGIADEMRRTIFEPFFTTHSNGTGLGLAICRKLCGENGAEISVRNNESTGCTFTVTTHRNHRR